MRLDQDNSPEADAFVGRVINVVFEWKELDEESRRDCEMYVRACHSHGFSVNDAAKFVRCTYEFDPNLDEDVALRRMAEIEKRYER